MTLQNRLKRLCNFGHKPVIAGCAKHLNAERHAGLIKTTGKRNAAGKGHCWQVGDAKPPHVGFHRLAVDFADRPLVMWEGSRGGGWTDDHIDIFKQVKPGAGNA